MGSCWPQFTKVTAIILTGIFVFSSLASFIANINGPFFSVLLGLLFLVLEVSLLASLIYEWTVPMLINIIVEGFQIFFLSIVFFFASSFAAVTISSIPKTEESSIINGLVSVLPAVLGIILFVVAFHFGCVIHQYCIIKDKKMHELARGYQQAAQSEKAAAALELGKGQKEYIA